MQPIDVVEVEGEKENAAIVVVDAPGELAAGRKVDPHRESVLVYLASLHTVPGRRTAISALRRIARILGVDPEWSDGNCWQQVPWCSLGARETTYVQAKLEASGAAPNTTKLTMAILRQVHWHAFRLGHMSGDAYARAKTVKVAGKRAPRGRALKADEIVAVSKALGRRPSPFREMSLAAWGIGIGCGLRREEFVRLGVGSVLQDGKILRVMGKGRKERDQKVPAWIRGLLWAWLEKRRGLELTTEALFPRWRNGKVQDEPASVDSMWRFLKGLQEGSGVETFSPHDMRRTVATSMLRKTDAKVVQGILGHENVSTTLGYDRRDEEEMSALQDDALDDLGKGIAAELEDVLAGNEDDLLLFHRGAQAVTKGWVRKQAALLVRGGKTRTEAVEALSRIGVTKHGRAIEESDL